MASDLLQIGNSGTIAARSALDVTAQNIANANNADYARRSLGLAEVTAPGSIAYYSQSSMSGVRVDQIGRTDSVFLQNEARRTGSDVSRAVAELSGLRGGEAALEQAGIYPAIVEFEASLARLDSDPLDGSLRAAVLENGRTMTNALRIADSTLGAAGDQIRFEANAQAEQINLHTTELARINATIIRTKPGTSSHAALLDQRDAQLARLSGAVGITATYEPSGVVNVSLGAVSGPALVNGTQTSPFAVVSNPDGTLGFTLGGATANPASGSLAGHAQALISLRDLGSEVDALAAQIIQQVNNAQANGTAPDGTSGQDFFSGSDASDIALSLTSGSGIATAPAGAPAGSRDTGNLDVLRAALADGGPAETADRILYQLAGAISGRSVTRDALATIADTAQAALSNETAVNLDSEAANLVRYQQAFQASGRVIQVASDIFDTILGIR